ncbi:MAG: endolytic transglycosylase MltG [Candidatus Portiera sp.]|nr:endolytic transglycosylase MltG [Portiera sp.]
MSGSTGLPPKNIKYILGVGLIVLILILGFTLGKLIAYSIISTKLNTDEDIVLVVDKGQGLVSIINELHSKEIISNPRFLKLAYYIHGIPSNIQVGEYLVTPSMSVKQLIDNIAIGKQRLQSIKIDIGTTFAKFYKKLIKHPHIKPTTANMAVVDIMNLLESPYRNPEGLFYADTYLFYSGSKDIDILRTAHERLLKVLDEEWQNRAPDLSYQNSYEALTMASIIEKETGLDSERPLIAGVFQNRLRLGMRLQTDPTIIYGLGDEYKGNIRRSHLRQPTPYNTYVIYGLPPTPISLVDLRAIRAALNPEPSDYIFFVAKGGGAHKFSVTLKEHNAAVRKYLLGQ